MPESNDPPFAQPIANEQSPTKSVRVTPEETTNDAVGDQGGPQKFTNGGPTSPLIELIRTAEGKIARAVCVGKEDGTIRLAGGSNINYEGRGYSVPELPSALQEGLVLPTKFPPMGPSKDLFESVLSFFQKHVKLPSREHTLLAYWSIATWFPDFLPFFPSLEVTGPSAGVDVLFKALMTVCRRPVMLADVSPSSLRAFPISELLPTLLIRQPQLTKRMASILDASAQPGYLVSHGKEYCRLYCPKCIYVDEVRKSDALLKTSLSVHVESNSWQSQSLLANRETAQDFQNRLFSYRLFSHDKVARSNFRVSGFRPETCAIAEVLGAAIVDNTELQARVIALMGERDKQSRVDRSSGIHGMVVRAVLLHCHESDQPKLFVREIAETVNQIYRQEGESSKVSSETVGHVLKSLGVYSQRLGSAGRGFLLQKALHVQAHRLGAAYDVLPEVPACGYCNALQKTETEKLVQDEAVVQV